MKLALLVAVPAAVVTLIGPDDATVGTVAVICVLLSTENAADVPLNFTSVAPVRLVPVILTLVPTGPLVGAKALSVGAGVVTVKLALLVAVPLGVVTLMGPVAAPAGTVALICESLLTEKLAVVPLNLTAVAPVRSLPVIVTLVPADPLVGANAVRAGAGVVPPPAVVKWYTCTPHWPKVSLKDPVLTLTLRFSV